MLKAVDYGWTAWDVYQSGRVLANPNASRGDKLLAGLNIALAVAFEAIEPDDELPVALPLDDVGRRAVMVGARTAFEEGGEQALQRFVRNRLGDLAGNVLQRMWREAGRDVAMGINDRGQLFDFARQTQSYWYGEWESVGLTDGPVSSFNFGPSFEQAMNRAGRIHFNLDGIRGDPVDFARLGGTGDFGEVPFTARELYLIWRNPEWLAKTTFYRNGQLVPSPFGP